MIWSLAHFRSLVRPGSAMAIGWVLAGIVASSAHGDSSPADPRLQGLRATKGVKVRLIAAEPTIVDPAAMAFDDQGNLFVAEWKPAERSIETWETLPLPEGGTTRVLRNRKSSTDVVKRLKDADGDGFFEASEVVLEGCELPTCVFPSKNCLYLACVGRLEKWSDEDGDGKFETRTVLADGFSAIDHRGLSSIALGPDGWLYLTTGDHQNRIVGSDGARVDLLGNGGVLRLRPDGSRLSLFAMGLRNPQSGVAFDANFHPTLIDGDHEDGSKFQGNRLIQPAEEADYGWRTRIGSRDGSPDFDRAAAAGERPGKLGPLARLGRGTPSGLVIYNGVAFPESFHDLRIVADPTRRAVHGFKIENRGGLDVFLGETTLLTSEDDQFRPIQVAVGADGALYVLDRRGHWSDRSPSNGEGKAGRIYQLQWVGDTSSPAKPLKPNHWKRLFDADANQLVFKYIASPDLAEANRALRELVDRGATNLPYLIGYATNTSAGLHQRLLGIQGARHFWSETVENVMIALLSDPEPEVRRLAAQSLGNEPKGPTIRLVPKLAPHLDDPDPRVAREIVLALSRHAESRAQQYAAVLLRWLYTHPQANPILKDGFVRGIERLGDPGVEEVALAIRTRSGVEREVGVSLFNSLRASAAAEQIEDLVKIPDLAPAERIALIRQFAEFPAGITLPTQGLADWAAKHGELTPAEKIAILDACRLSGNPVSILVLSLLESDDESVRQAATRLAGLSRPPRALERLVERLNEKGTSDKERLLLIQTLGAFGPKAFAAIEQAFRQSDDRQFRLSALNSLARADQVKSLPELETTLTATDQALRDQAVRILGQSLAGSEILARAYRDKTIGRRELPAVLLALRDHDRTETRKLRASIEDEETRGGASPSSAANQAIRDQSGDPWTGLGVFFRESSRCSGCHQVESRGFNLGPNLTLGASTPSSNHLLDAMLRPAHEIAANHGSSRVTLKDGRSFVGISQAKDPKFTTIREADGREVRIAAELIREITTEPGSLMPASIALDLTPEEITQVIAFLQSKPAQTALKNGPKRLDRVLTSGPFEVGADRLRIPLDRVELDRPLPGQDGRTATWTAQDATNWGSLNLRGSLGSKPGRAYLAVSIRSSQDQVAALRFGIEGASRVYLNGSKVADVSEHEPTALVRAFDPPRETTLAPLPDLVRLSLKSGANLLIVGVDRTGFGDARAAFEILAPEPIELALPQK